MKIIAHVELPEWDEPGQGYESLTGAIVREATTQLTDASYDAILKETRVAVMDTIESQVGEIVALAITAQIRPINRYGEPTGKATTLREEIVEAADTWMKEPVRKEDGKKSDYHLDATIPRAQYFVMSAVRDQLAAVYEAEIAKATTEIRAEFDGKLTGMVRDSVKRILGV